MKVAERVNLKSSYQKEKIVTMCGDGLTVYTYIESLYCTLKTNKMLYVNYISI